MTALRQAAERVARAVDRLEAATHGRLQRDQARIAGLEGEITAISAAHQALDSDHTALVATTDGLSQRLDQAILRLQSALNS